MGLEEALYNYEINAKEYYASQEYFAKFWTDNVDICPIIRSSTSYINPDEDVDTEEEGMAD